MRSFADRDGLRGRAKQARADALPEISVYGNFLRYQDPGFFNSPNIEEFPPEILQAFRPIASNLWDGYGSVRQTLWSFSLGKAIRAARYAEHLGDENVRTVRQNVALRAIFAYNAFLLSRDQVRVGETVVQQKEKQLEMARHRRGAGVATDLEVLRFEVDLANARTTLLRLQGASDLTRGDLNAVMVQPTDTPVEPSDALEFADVPADQPSVVREATANRPELEAIAWNEKIYDEAIGIYKADMQPRLDLNGAYGWSVRETRATSSSPTTRSGASRSRSRCPSSTAGARPARSPRRGPTAPGSARTGSRSRPRSTSRRSRPSTGCASRRASSAPPS